MYFRGKPESFRINTYFFVEGRHHTQKKMVLGVQGVLRNTQFLLFLSPCRGFKFLAPDVYPGDRVEWEYTCFVRLPKRGSRGPGSVRFTSYLVSLGVT